MALQRDTALTSMVELTNTNTRMIKAVREACRMVPELAIPKEAEVDEQVYKLAIGVRDARTDLAKVQLELNLQIAGLQLKAQPSTPPEVKDQHATVVTEAIAVVDSAIADYTQLFEKLFEVLKSLQEDPNVQWLETEAQEL